MSSTTRSPRFPWEEHLGPDGTLAVDASGVNAGLRNTQFTAVRVKDAIADRFTQRFGRRPSVDTADPDLRINVVVRNERATISIDLSGQPLHRRGYREPGVQVEAPMKETLAAALLMVADWPAIAAAGGGFVDPMCGSGTLPIEAALIAGDVAPGLTRESWGFSRWLGHDAEAWERAPRRGGRSASERAGEASHRRGLRLRPRGPWRSRGPASRAPASTASSRSPSASSPS